MQRILMFLALVACLCLATWQPSWANVGFYGVVDGFAPDTVMVSTASGDLMVPATAGFEVDGYPAVVSSLSVGTPVSVFVASGTDVVAVPGGVSSADYPYADPSAATAWSDTAFETTALVDTTMPEGYDAYGNPLPYYSPPAYGAYVPPPTFGAFLVSQPYYVPYAYGYPPYYPYGYLPGYVASSSVYLQFGDVGLGYTSYPGYFGPASGFSIGFGFDGGYLAFGTASPICWDPCVLPVGPGCFAPCYYSGFYPPVATCLSPLGGMYAPALASSGFAGINPGGGFNAAAVDPSGLAGRGRFASFLSQPNSTGRGGWLASHGFGQGAGMGVGGDPPLAADPGMHLSRNGRMALGAGAAVAMATAHFGHHLALTTGPTATGQVRSMRTMNPSLRSGATGTSQQRAGRASATSPGGLRPGVRTSGPASGRGTVGARPYATSPRSAASRPSYRTMSRPAVPHYSSPRPSYPRASRPFTPQYRTASPSQYRTMSRPSMPQYRSTVRPMSAPRMPSFSRPAPMPMPRAPMSMPRAPMSMPNHRP